LYENYVFSASGDCTAKQWDKTTGQLIQTFSMIIPGDSAYVVFSVAVSEDGIYLITGTGSVNELVNQWRIADGAKLGSYQGHANAVHTLLVKGDYLFTGSTDSTVKQWVTSSRQLVRTFTGSFIWVFNCLPRSQYYGHGISRLSKCSLFRRL
jgi:WD40 repeat protein